MSPAATRPERRLRMGGTKDRTPRISKRLKTETHSCPADRQHRSVCFLPNRIQHGALSGSQRSRCPQAAEGTAGCQRRLFVDPFGPTCAHLWLPTLKPACVFAVLLLLLRIFVVLFAAASSVFSCLHFQPLFRFVLCGEKDGGGSKVDP